MMKTSTKLTIGLSIAAVAGVASAVIVSDKVYSKVRHACNRRKIKKFVNDKLGGNEKLLGVVENLSDTDIDSLLSVVDKVKEGKDKISVYGNSVKEATDNAKDKLTEMVDSVF